MIPIARTYPAREHYKNAYFLWLYNLTPTLFMTNFLKHNFDARLQKTCDATVHDIPLHWYKLNWRITCDLPESWTVLSGAFLFLLGIYAFVLKRSTGPRSAVGNVSGYRCVSDCRSRGREFDPGSVPYFRGDWSWNNFYGHSPPFRWFIQEGLLSVTSESMCTNYWLTACSSLPRKKCG